MQCSTCKEIRKWLLTLDYDGPDFFLEFKSNSPLCYSGIMLLSYFRGKKGSFLIHTFPLTPTPSNTSLTLHTYVHTLTLMHEFCRPNLSLYLLNYLCMPIYMYIYFQFLPCNCVIFPAIQTCPQCRKPLINLSYKLNL